MGLSDEATINLIENAIKEFRKGNIKAIDCLIYIRKILNGWI